MRILAYLCGENRVFWVKVPLQKPCEGSFFDRVSFPFFERWRFCEVCNRESHFYQVERFAVACLVGEVPSVASALPNHAVRPFPWRVVCVGFAEVLENDSAVGMKIQLRSWFVLALVIAVVVICGNILNYRVFHLPL